MTAICCVFHHLATRGVEILLGKLALSHTDQNNTFPTQNSNFKVDIFQHVKTASSGGAAEFSRL